MSDDRNLLAGVLAGEGEDDSTPPPRRAARPMPADETTREEQS